MAFIVGPAGKGSLSNELTMLLAGALTFYISNALYRRLNRD